ncbi:hypothetical protein GCM10020000_86840 [Streptomyces olivoverticillatus]
MTCSASGLPPEAEIRPVRTSVDLRAYEHRARQGPCFICAFLAGHPDFSHAVVFEDDEHVAFLDRWPTLPGKVLVAPRAHVEHVVRELDEAAYLRLMCLVRRVACAVERVFLRRSGRICCRWGARRGIRTSTGMSPGSLLEFLTGSSSSLR